ncbi:MAG: RecX family transcriptional regulator [Chloroflexi bacterium]|nr:RecX family transcriptional regulator [Chloroflexota bacterium]
MGQITALEPQVKHSNRFNLYVDNEFALGLSVLLAAPLRVGQEITPEQLAVLAREEAREVAHEKALRFLEPRPRSVAEVKEHLRKKKIPADVIDETLTRLKDAQLLDDAAFAQYWVENRETFRPRGGRALRFELKRKGVSAAAITDAVGEIDETEGAYRAVETRAQRWRALERREFFEKVSAFLVRRGFSYDIAKQTAKRLWDETREA